MGRSRISPGDGDPRHGSWNGYHNLKCRCEACTAAWADWYLRWTHAKRERVEAHAARERERYRRNIADNEAPETSQ